MKKICITFGTFLLTLLVVSSGIAFSAAPLDENFGDYTMENTDNTLTVGGLVFTTDGITDDAGKLSVIDFSIASEGAAEDSTHFTRSVITCDFSGSHEPTMFQFSSSDLDNNFRMKSLYVLGTMLTSGASSRIDINGYEGGAGGTLKASVTGIDLATSAVYGTGSAQITYIKTINNDTEKGGLLTFGSGWTEIDTVVFTDSDNDQPLEIALDSLNFSETSLPFKGFIDNPKVSQKISGMLSVSGWALDYDGVAKVEVLIDDKSPVEAVYGKSRPDVNAVYPQYENSNSGFTFTMNPKTLTTGRHTVNVRVTNNSGIVKHLPAVEFILTRPVIGCLDDPGADRGYSGIVGVSGWMLDPNGVKKVEVHVDDKLVGTAKYGLLRDDVYSVYPEYTNKNPGFNFSIRTALLEPGKHTVKIIETDNNDKTNIIATRNFYLTGSVIGCLDSPIINGEYSGTVGVSGWALDSKGVDKIDVYVDGVWEGKATYGILRNDVYNIYTEYNNRNSGFVFSIKNTSLAPGKHMIKIEETSNDGKVKVIEEREFVLK